MNELANKVVLVTGASSGIGEATATLLAESGATVLLGARRLDRLETLVETIAANGGTARARALDVTDLADMQALVDGAVAEFGRVDVIVNNAAATR